MDADCPKTGFCSKHNRSHACALHEYICADESCTCLTEEEQLFRKLAHKLLEANEALEQLLKKF